MRTTLYHFLVVLFTISFRCANAQNTTTTTRAPTDEDATQALTWWVILLAALVAFPILLLSCYFLLMWQQKALQDYKNKYEDKLKKLGENIRRVQDQVNAAKAKKSAEAEAEAAANKSNPLYVPEMERTDAEEEEDPDDLARELEEQKAQIREGLLKGKYQNVKGPMMPVRIPQDWREPIDRSGTRAQKTTTRSYIRSAAPVYLSPSAMRPSNDDWNTAGGPATYSPPSAPMPRTATREEAFSLESIAADAAAAHNALRDIKRSAPLRHVESLI